MGAAARGKTVTVHSRAKMRSDPGVPALQFPNSHGRLTPKCQKVYKFFLIFNSFSNFGSLKQASFVPQMHRSSCMSASKYVIFLETAEFSPVLNHFLWFYSEVCCMKKAICVI